MEMEYDKIVSKLLTEKKLLPYAIKIKIYGPPWNPKPSIFYFVRYNVKSYRQMFAISVDGEFLDSQEYDIIYSYTKLKAEFNQDMYGSKVEWTNLTKDEYEIEKGSYAF